MKRKISKYQVDIVAREIHTFIAYAILATYYATKKLSNATTNEEAENAQIELARLLSTGETLYDDLSTEQKDSMEKTAYDLLKLIQ